MLLVSLVINCFIAVFIKQSLKKTKKIELKKL